jgi:hypothetical protein
LTTPSLPWLQQQSKQQQWQQPWQQQQHAELQHCSMTSSGCCMHHQFVHLDGQQI